MKSNGSIRQSILSFVFGKSASRLEDEKLEPIIEEVRKLSEKVRNDVAQLETLSGDRPSVH